MSLEPLFQTNLQAGLKHQRGQFRLSFHRHQTIRHYRHRYQHGHLHHHYHYRGIHDNHPQTCQFHRHIHHCPNHPEMKVLAKDQCCHYSHHYQSHSNKGLDYSPTGCHQAHHRHYPPIGLGRLETCRPASRLDCRRNHRHHGRRVGLGR